MTVTNEAREAWLLISASTAGGVLPARPEVAREVRRLADRIRHQGGTTRVLSIAARDYFQAPGGQAARDAVEQAAAELAAFEAAALRAETSEHVPIVERLRVVEER